MYSIFEELLRTNGITAYKVAKDTGISTATMTDWKKGRSTPKADKLQKIADYFGVSLDYLVGKEKAPTESGERKISDRDIMFALWGDTNDMDKGDLDDVKRYAAFVRERKKQK